MHPAERHELRILNQFTETFSVTELAEKVAEAGKLVGLDVITTGEVVLAAMAESTALMDSSIDVLS